MTADSEQFNAFAELVKWRSWAVRLLGIGYLGDDEDLRNQINAAPESTVADARKASGAEEILSSPEARAAVAKCQAAPTSELIATTSGARCGHRAQWHTADARRRLAARGCEHARGPRPHRAGRLDRGA